MIDLVHVDKIVAEHGASCTCETCTYSREHMLLCAECNKLHEKMAFCTKCSTCLYKHSKQVENDWHPLFKCSRCNTINFWD